MVKLFHMLKYFTVFAIFFKVLLLKGYTALQEIHLHVCAEHH